MYISSKLWQKKHDEKFCDILEYLLHMTGSTNAYSLFRLENYPLFSYFRNRDNGVKYGLIVNNKVFFVAFILFLILLSYNFDAISHAKKNE
uniref:Uncharacterized protein n=1 Tax=Onchocerca volvulus TaxID=6282 RepID=A0A8R1XMB7_ONCVO